jgi:hypothetical protein
VRAWFLIVLAAVPLTGVTAYCVAFGADPVALVLRAISYNHGIGVWGYTYLARLPYESPLRFDLVFNWAIRYGRYLTLLGLGLVWAWRARREALPAGLLTLAVAFLALTHAFSIQYLVWVVPLAILEADHVWLRRFTLAACAYMLLAYLTLILGLHITTLMPWPQADLWLIIPAGLPAWLVCLGWLVARLRGGRGAGAAQPVEAARPAGVRQPEPL